jgi:hypothetical protein
MLAQFSGMTLLVLQWGQVHVTLTLCEIRA